MTDTWDPRYDEEPPPDQDLPTEAEEDALLAQMDAAATRARRIAHETDRLRIQDLARRQLAKEQRATQQRPQLVTLTDFLNQPDEDPTYRIDKLWPTGGRVLLPAKGKAGKTTFVGNALRSLADGTPFLDTFGVRQAGHIVLIDDELDPRTQRRWLRDFTINTTDAIHVMSLRGKVSTFDILDDEIRTEWAKDIAGADIVILDCLRPVLDALGLDENHDVGRFLVYFDALLAEAGCSESLLIHHMGHGSERSRGDSRLIDWPDAIWNLVRDKDDDDPDLDDLTGARYFSAFGRDVNYPQSEVTYNQQTRRLTLGEHAPSRRQATAKRTTRTAERAVLEAVYAQHGITKRGLRDAVAEAGVKHNPHIDDAIERLLQDGRITRIKVGQAHCHYPGTEPGEPPEDDLFGQTGVPNYTQEQLGTVHTNKTAGQPTTPEPTVPSVPNRAQKNLGTTVPSVPVPTGTVNRAQTLKGMGTVNNHPDPEQETGHGPELKPCADCPTLIPANQTRCTPCTYAFIEARRGATR